MLNGRKRVIIEHVSPEIDGGAFPAKRVVGQAVDVEADVFTDGHDVVVASLLYRKGHETEWQEEPMRFLQNDRWTASFTVDEMCTHQFTITGWIDHFKTWQRDLRKKWEAGQDVTVDLKIGAELVEKAAEHASAPDAGKMRALAAAFRAGADTEKSTYAALGDELSALMAQYADRSMATTYEKELSVTVDRELALFSAWYEVFPRSVKRDSSEHGTFNDCRARLPEIAEMGFDIVYLPPIHPIGETHRKGKNNSPVAEEGDPGSPWAIGSSEGGHKSINPKLGTMEDFEQLVSAAREHNMEIALDLAFQCSPDHPYVKEHPEWFLKRPDGTIQYAENPPKKYEDIVPFNFETENWKELWQELKSVVVFWIEKGIRVFRVDNPHTKSFPFWEWLITDLKKEHGDLIFLAEAFTRPKIMYRLAKIGFTQSYTYFTWRNTKSEITNYLKELTQTEVREYFRPNFWPNTPDILPEFLQYGGRPAFIIKLVLAATLSSNYGLYAPAFELLVNEALPGKEEYLNSEKYEVKQWPRDIPGSLTELMQRINKIRRDNPALRETNNLQFYDVDNDYLLFYGKESDDGENIIMVLVNLDPFHTQSGFVNVPLDKYGIRPDQPYLAHDLISNDRYIWQGPRNYVELNPSMMPAHILRIHRRMKRESDFDYYM